jgi:hypothetical protein
MQLDKTAIVISQRQMGEISDLSLLVMRAYWRPILVFSLVGVAPFAIVNFFLTWPLVHYDQLAIESVRYSSSWTYIIRYYVVMIGAVFLQAPLAMSLVTYFIGQAVFVEQLSFRSVLRAVFGQSVPVSIVLGVFRFGLLSYIPLVLLFLYPGFSPETEVIFYFFGMVVSMFFIRAFRPFAPEILVLERSRLWGTKKQKEQQSYRQRNTWLHSTQYNDNFGVHLLLSLSALLAVCYACLLSYLSIGLLIGVWEWGIWMDVIIFPASLWAIASWMTILRLLFYMNSRIRTEGWELELRFKAESQRLREAIV